MRTVERIRVWDGLSDAAAEFGPGPGPEGALSAMVEISNVQQALYRHIAHHAADPDCPVSVEILDKTRVGSIHADGRDGWPELTLEREGAPPRTIHTRLLVGADGHNSPVRTFAGIESFGWPYHCKGLVATMRTGLSEHHAEPVVDASAWQRFLPTGTLACLPLSPSTGTIVWALPPDLADALSTMHRASTAATDLPTLLATMISAGFRLPWPALETLLYRAKALAASDSPDWAAFQAELHAALIEAEQVQGAAAPSPHLGMVPPLGDAVDAKSVASFPLQLKHAGCYLGSTLNRHVGSAIPAPSTLLAGALTALGLTPGGAARGNGQARTVLVGDAAHTTHPLAGQGLNLGIQDVRALNTALADAARLGMDYGLDSALREYEAERYLPNQAMISVTDHLHWLFAKRPTSPYAPGTPGVGQSVRQAALQALVWARSTGLDVVNELGPLKDVLLQNAGSQRR